MKNPPRLPPQRFLRCACALIALALFIAPAVALQPDEILLVTNKNSPDSQKLAQLYCQLRGVPTTQIAAIDVPDSEEMAFSTYETSVVAPLRKFITDHQLNSKIKCLLTFYGVPFRVSDKQNTPAENEELAQLRETIATTTDQLKSTITDLESYASTVNPTFQPATGQSLSALMARSQAAIEAVTSQIASMPDAAQRQAAVQRLVKFLEVEGGQAELDRRIGPSQRADPNKTPDQRETWVRLHDRVEVDRAQVADLEDLRWDPIARAKLRQISSADFGLVGALRVQMAQAEYLVTDQTGAATDNELALLWWTYYPRHRWLENPLYLKFVGNAPTTLMVMRLDGPDPATVEKMMRTSVEVEKTGLTGIIAIDARGIQPIDDKGNLNSFGEFDETLRHLALLVRTKTKLKIAFDDQDIVFPPHFAKNVACYCGWYSVQHYIPGCDFNPGAVGYHVASFEMTQLHEPTTEWVRGLLSDGVVATLGAVAEPYLTAFPKPDDFFPLLLTGKLTLAEVYWKTNPMTSWMISFIGDPLYTPYKADPAFAVEDLPPGLRKAFP